MAYIPSKKFTREKVYWYIYHGDRERVKVPSKPEGFGNAYDMLRAFETKRYCRLAIWVARDKGMITNP